MGLVLAAALIIPQRTLAAGPAPVDLKSAGHFAILGASSVSSTGGGTINGDLGLSPGSGTSITGILTNQVNGIIYQVDAAGPLGPYATVDPGLLSTSRVDSTAAYNDADGRTGGIVLPSAMNLGGQKLAPGLYRSPDSLQISGDLTLDAGGDPNAVWIFQMSSTLTTASGPGASRVILAGGAQARNVFWKVGSSATIGTFSDFKGTILALSDISILTSGTVEGRALAGRDITFNGASNTLPATLAGGLLTKTLLIPNNGVARVGETVVFQITVANTGTVTLVSVPVEDRYSTNFLAFTNATPPPVDMTNDGILNWTNIVNLAPGASTNILVTFTAVGSTAGQLATNVVEIPGQTNTATYSTGRPGYSVDKTVSNAVAFVGDPVVFQITLANTGDVTLATIPVEDRYSTSILSFVGATPATIDITDDGILNWANVGPLAPGATTNLIVNFTAVGSTAGQSATNLVVASPPNMPVKTNAATYSTSVFATNSPGYTLNKALTSPTNRPALVGESVVFQITVANTGNVPLAVMPVEDLYPTNILSFVSATPATVDTNNDGILDWTNVGPLAPGATTNLIVTFTAVGSTAGQLATNLATASSPVLPVQTSTATFSTINPGYRVTKTVTSPVSGAPLIGHAIVFRITVTNSGDLTLTTVPVEDLYPTNILSFVSATPATVDTINDGILNWSDVGPLAPGASTNLIVTFNTVGSTAGHSATNLVVVSPTNLPPQTNSALFIVNASPTPVELRSFSAAYDGRDVLVKWATGVELNNLGFNVYRAANLDGTRIKLNSALIPGTGNSEGQGYEWRDAGLDPAIAYYYWLEDVSSTFRARMHGPAVVYGTTDSTSSSAANTLAAFEVTAGGLYRIGWNAIQSAQLQLPAAGVSASELQVNVGGQPVATYVNAQGDTLADGDSVLFYAPDAVAPQTCTLSLSTNAVAIDLVFARPSRTAGKVQYAFAGTNEEVRFQATTNFVRYLLADFTTSPVWVLDVSDAARCRLLYGFSYVAGADGHTAVYLSYPGLADTTFCLAVGDGAVHEVTTLRRAP